MTTEEEREALIDIYDGVVSERPPKACAVDGCLHHATYLDSGDTEWCACHFMEGLADECEGQPDPLPPFRERLAAAILAAGFRQATREPSETDERIQAWETIAKHPIFAPCYPEERPLIESVVDRLDRLADLEQTVNELAPAPATHEPSEADREAIIDALLDELGWEWNEVPEEHIVSSREILGDMADRVLAVIAARQTTHEPSEAECVDIANRAQAVTGRSVWPSTVRAILTAAHEHQSSDGGDSARAGVDSSSASRAARARRRTP